MILPMVVFVPSRGFLFFYSNNRFTSGFTTWLFSSPHGDFSFSIINPSLIKAVITVFVPSRGFLFFYYNENTGIIKNAKVFVPSRGFLFFYGTLHTGSRPQRCKRFSFPHGDFSFSIRMYKYYDTPYGCFRPLTGISLFLFQQPFHFRLHHLVVFVPSRGFLFFYNKSLLNKGGYHGFRPLTGISLFL